MSLDTHPLISANAERRLNDTIALIRENKAIWILKDEDGCVMLTADDEDGVPVWPDAELAKLWATEDWSHCEPMAISYDDWLKKWTPGLIQDDLMLMICPVPGEDGEVYPPEEFADRLLA
ncbi:DUF2750 domain-containing protein [Alteromonas pelagimontana]|uniref:DUF2750 domain-containing protein n=1 Tax=Alteromonas pelagimontana TaxID=1858656 RepID=A0A6M4MH64_9ALTE|nr:DUF2750 domain-containing protein [Alteromonas pelagimontana]QJR82327.1 DUF2750 domain-containing protein [Alteromonas pelagimontana]